jgi:hypothetical protein
VHLVTELDRCAQVVAGLMHVVVAAFKDLVVVYR